MKSRYSFKRRGNQDYIVYFSDVDIGSVIKLDDKLWHAYTPNQRRVGKFSTREEAAVHLLTRYRLGD
jgi:hypothetical protein